MVFLLLASGGIYFLPGDRQEAIILLGFVLVVVAITLYQENKTERALEAVPADTVSHFGPSPRRSGVDRRRRPGGCRVVRGGQGRQAPPGPPWRRSDRVSRSIHMKIGRDA